MLPNDRRYFSVAGHRERATAPHPVDGALAGELLEGSAHRLAAQSRSSDELSLSRQPLAGRIPPGGYGLAQARRHDVWHSAARTARHSVQRGADG